MQVMTDKFSYNPGKEAVLHEYSIFKSDYPNFVLVKSRIQVPIVSLHDIKIKHIIWSDYRYSVIQVSIQKAKKDYLMYVQHQETNN
jgi:hypothetical protein